MRTVVQSILSFHITAKARVFTVNLQSDGAEGHGWRVGGQLNMHFFIKTEHIGNYIVTAATGTMDRTTFHAYCSFFFYKYIFE